MDKKAISVFGVNLAAGGAEKVISLLLPKLVGDYKVFLVLLNDKVHFPIPSEVNVIVLNKQSGLINKIFGFFFAIYTYRQIISKNNIGISMSFLTRPNLINGLQRVFFPRLRIILSERCFPSIAYRSNIWRYRLYKLLFPLIYNRADTLFSNSHHINADLKRNFGINIPMTVIYNPVDAAIQKSEKFGTKGFSLAFVGKLVEIKNPLLLINAMVNLQYDDITATIVGDGPLRKNLENEIANSSLKNRVKFTGTVQNVNKYLYESTCFILTSNSEGFPNVILEAMACGLPVIATNCMSGPLEIINNNKEISIEHGGFAVCKYGILVNVNDAIGLSAAISELYSNPVLRDCLANRSLERVQEFSIDNIYSQIDKLLKDA